MLREDNARQGFFEHDHFQSVKRNLLAAYADATEFAYLSGWRKGKCCRCAGMPSTARLVK